MEKSRKPVISSHDRFFKKLFSNKEGVNEFVSKTFPPAIAEKLDLETLELDKTEYIDSKLRTSFSDVVYDCKYGKTGKVKISLLFEHKSQTERFPQLQLLGYMLKIWQTQIEQAKEARIRDFKLSAVIPIIFYHGEDAWKKQTFENYFTGIDEHLINFIPKFDYQLIDLSDYSDSEIKKLFEKLQLQIGLLLMKNIFDEQKLLNDLTSIFAQVNELLNNQSGRMFFESIVAYLHYGTNIDTQKFVEKMETITTQGADIFVSTAMRLKKEGIEKEKKRVAFSLLKQGVAEDIILIATNLTQKQLNYLKTLKEYQIELETI